MDGVEAAEAAADHAHGVAVDLITPDQPIEHRRSETVEVGSQLGLEIHLTLAGSVERTCSERAREAQVLETVALLLRAFEAAKNDNDRTGAAPARRNAQIAWDGQPLIIQFESFGRRGKQ